MPRRGFVVLATGLNDEQWARVSKILKAFGWSPYKFVKIAVLRLVRAVEEGEFREDEGRNE